MVLRKKSKNSMSHSVLPPDPNPPRPTIFSRISFTIDSHIYEHLAVATEFTLLYITLRPPTTLPVGQSTTTLRGMKVSANAGAQPGPTFFISAEL